MFDLRGVSGTFFFVLNAPILYPLKTSENRKVFWRFQGVEKGCIRNKWNKMGLVKKAAPCDSNNMMQNQHKIRFLSSRNQSIDLQRKSIGWFLCEETSVERIKNAPPKKVDLWVENCKNLITIWKFIFFLVAANERFYLKRTYAKKAILVFLRT